MDKAQKKQAINDILLLHYGDYEPWCKVLHLDDFDETHFTGRLADEKRREDHQEEIDIIHNYIRDPKNDDHCKAFIAYFIETVIYDHTPEELMTHHLEDQEWKRVDKQERDERFDEIMKRSLDDLSDDSHSQGDDRIRFIRLMDRFLNLLEEDALFFINVGPDEDMPAVIGMDQETIGIYFYTY